MFSRLVIFSQLASRPGHPEVDLAISRPGRQTALQAFLCLLIIPDVDGLFGCVVIVPSPQIGGSEPDAKTDEKSQDSDGQSTQGLPPQGLTYLVESLEHGTRFAWKSTRSQERL